MNAFGGTRRVYVQEQVHAVKGYLYMSSHIAASSLRIIQALLAATLLRSFAGHGDAVARSLESGDVGAIELRSQQAKVQGKGYPGIPPSDVRCPLNTLNAGF